MVPHLLGKLARVLVWVRDGPEPEAERVEAGHGEPASRAPQHAVDGEEHRVERRDLVAELAAVLALHAWLSRLARRRSRIAPLEE